MKFSAFIQPDAIVTSLTSTDRDGVIRELVESLARSGAIEADAVESILEALLDRERGGTTGFGFGVAAPHCKHPRVSKLVGTVGISSRGIEFHSLDGKPVFSVFLLLCPAGQSSLHSQAMEVIFRNLQQPPFRRLLRQADSQARVMELLNEVDGK